MWRTFPRKIVTPSWRSMLSFFSTSLEPGSWGENVTTRQSRSFPDLSEPLLLLRLLLLLCCAAAADRL